MRWTGRSRFWSELENVDPISRETKVLTDIWSALDGEHRTHPILTRREDAARERDRAAKKARMAAREKRRNRGVK